MIAMTDQQKVREAFEAWLLDRHVVTNPARYPGSGIYVVEWIDSMWEGWQAALAHASGAAVKESLAAHSASDFDELHDLAKWFRERGDELNSAWLEKIARQYVAPATCKEVLQVVASAEECSVVAAPQESSTKLVVDQVAADGKLVAACCGRPECGGECGNEWQGMIHADGFLAGIRDDGTVAGYAIETHYIPAKGFIDHGEFLAIVMDDNGCDAETRVTKANLRHALGHVDVLSNLQQVSDGLRKLGHYPDSAFSKWADLLDQAIAGRRGDGNG